MTKGIFITATGTDVGKTFVCGLLVKKMRNLGLNCGYYKPVLSGLEEINGELVPGDAKYVLKTSGIKRNPMECVSYAFKPAVSPHLASRMESNPIELSKIKEDFNKVKNEYEYIVTEGAGGITCPFNLDDKKILLTDVIKSLNLDTIIVSPSGLGSINYAFLTAEYAKAQNINVKAFILNEYEENNFMHKDNKECIEKLTGVKVITSVKHNAKDLEINKDTLLSIFKEV